MNSIHLIFLAKRQIVLSFKPSSLVIIVFIRLGFFFLLSKFVIILIPTAPWIHSVRLLDQCSVPRDSYCQKFLVKPISAEQKRSDLVVPLAATIVAPGTFVYSYCTCSNTDTSTLVIL